MDRRTGAAAGRDRGHGSPPGRTSTTNPETAKPRNTRKLWFCNRALRTLSLRPLRPGGEAAFHRGPYEVAGFGPADAGHQQGVVLGVLLTHRRHYGQRESFLIE